jgi:glutamine synthetase adenylyltransferase
MGNDLQQSVDKIAFDKNPPDDELIREQVRSLRERIDSELVKEKDSRYDLKNGRGGLHDLDMVVQYFQLKELGSSTALRTRNTFKAIEALENEGHLDPESAQTIRQALGFYRNLLSKVRLYVGHSTNEFDANSQHAEAIAKLMGFENVDLLEKELIRHRKEVQDVFNLTFK